MSGVGLAVDAVSGQDDPVSQFYAVRTTRIVCRVGCASRAPRPENIAWFDDVASARAQGFRPCKRCRPEADHPQDTFRSSITVRAAAFLRLGLTVQETADRLHVSDRHLRRLIRQETGMSPRELVAP